MKERKKKENEMKKKILGWDAIAFSMLYVRYKQFHTHVEEVCTDIRMCNIL